MKSAVLITIIAASAVGIGAWLWHMRALDERSLPAAVGGTGSGYRDGTVPSGVIVSDSGLVTIHGMAIMDDSTGYPPVPYIRYTGGDGEISTKQLIFADARGCLPGAGDIPCAPTYAAAGAYPELMTGQKVRVSGYIRANRFLITELQTEEL